MFPEYSISVRVQLFESDAIIKVVREKIVSFGIRFIIFNGCIVSNRECYHIKEDFRKFSKLYANYKYEENKGGKDIQILYVELREGLKREIVF
ncbi:MAG: hypothetical protein AABW75_00105 [Nanoarchaeota archaeon]